MFNIMAAVLMTIGQCSGPGCALGQGGAYYTVPCQPVYEVPHDVIEYRTGGEAQTSLCYEKIYYGETMYSVPIVNGFAPEVTVYKMVGGGRYIVYDYRRKISVALCQAYAQKVSQPTKAQAPKKELEPPKASMPVPPKPEPPKKELVSPIKPVIKDEPKAPEPPKKVDAPKKEIAIEVTPAPKPVAEKVEPTPAAKPVEPKPTLAPKKELEAPAPKPTAAEVKPEEMISPLPPVDDPKPTSLPTETKKPKAPMRELFLPTSEDMRNPDIIPEPSRVIKPTYGDQR